MKTKYLLLLVSAIVSTVLLVTLLVGGCRKPAPTPTPKPPPPAVTPAPAPKPAVTPSPSPAPAPALKEAKLKFGTYVALSGAGAPWGVSSDRGIKMAIDEINAAGGIVVGNTRYTIDYVVYDHKYTSDGGLSSANKLVFEDKVNIIPYSFGSGPNLAGQTVHEPAKILFGTGAMAKEILGTAKPYTFRMQAGDATWAPIVHKWLRDQYPNAKKQAIFNRDDSWGRDAAKYSEIAAKAQGFTVTFSDWFKLGTADFAPVLTKIIATAPDILYATGTTIGESALITKQARGLGFTGLIVFTGLTPSLWFQIVTPEASKDTIAATATYLWSQEDPKFTPKQKAWAKKYEGLYKEPMLSATAPQAYDATIIFVEAIKRTQSLDPDKLRDAITKGKFDVLQGEATFGGKEIYGVDQEIMVPLPIYRYDATAKEYKLVALLPPK